MAREVKRARLAHVKPSIEHCVRLLISRVFLNTRTASRNILTRHKQVNAHDKRIDRPGVRNCGLRVVELALLAEDGAISHDFALATAGVPEAARSI